MICQRKFLVSRANIPIKGSNFTCYCYLFPDGKEEFVLVADYKGKVPLVRIHSECLTGDVFGSERCDCGQQLDLAIDHISREGGILIYLRQEGRGIGLFEKIKSYALQDEDGLDTVDSNLALGHSVDARSYGKAIQILQDLNVSKISLITNNPEKVKEVKQAGIQVLKVMPCRINITSGNKKYLEAKRNKLGHML